MLLIIAGFRCFECHMPNPPRKPRPVTVAAPPPFPSQHNHGRLSTSTTASFSGSQSIEQASSSSGSESDTSSGDAAAETGSTTNHPQRPGVAQHATSTPPPVFTATVKQPVLITEEAESSGQALAQVVVTAIAENLQESDTGSESGDELEVPAAADLAACEVEENVAQAQADEEERSSQVEVN